MSHSPEKLIAVTDPEIIELVGSTIGELEQRFSLEQTGVDGAISSSISDERYYAAVELSSRGIPHSYVSFDPERRAVSAVRAHVQGSRHNLSDLSVEFSRQDITYPDPDRWERRTKKMRLEFAIADSACNGSVEASAGQFFTSDTDRTLTTVRLGEDFPYTEYERGPRVLNKSADRGLLDEFIAKGFSLVNPANIYCPNDDS